MAEISRRTLFRGALMVAGAGTGAALGLTRKVHHKVAVPPPAPPADLVTALDRQRSLLADYDSLGAGASPVLPALRADVAAHGDALRGLLELYPGWRLTASGTGAATAGSAPLQTGQPPTAGTSSAPATAAGLATSSRSSAGALTASCTDWPAGEAHAAEVVPVLGSIAACLASHAQVLA